MGDRRPMPPIPPRAVRAAQGAARRDQVPLSAHAALPAPENRADALAILAAQDPTRLPELVPIRYGRMSASPFTFLRGSAAVMAEDLAAVPNSGIQTQLCGDAHLSNFGVFAAPDRRLVFDINDFDETLPGPFEWDVKRLAASIVVAARDRGFANDAGRDGVRAAASTYRAEIGMLASEDPLTGWYMRADVDDAMTRFTGRTRKALTKVAHKARRKTSLAALEKLTEMVDGRRRIVADPPLVVPLDVESDPADVQRVIAFYDEYGRSIGDDVRSILSRYRYVDMARKVVGVGSVGTRAIIVLLQSGDGDPLFLQCKEAGRSVLEPHTAPSDYPHGGRRVVEGQRLMQAASDIFLGWATDPGTGTDFYFRQLRDMKGGVEVETLDEALFVTYAGACARTLARAHARGGDAATIAGYVGEEDAFDAAITEWAIGAANSAERDHAAMTKAIDAGILDAVVDL